MLLHECVSCVVRLCNVACVCVVKRTYRPTDACFAPQVERIASDDRRTMRCNKSTEYERVSCCPVLSLPLSTGVNTSIPTCTHARMPVSEHKSTSGTLTHIHIQAHTGTGRGPWLLARRRLRNTTDLFNFTGVEQQLMSTHTNTHTLAHTHTHI